LLEPGPGSRFRAVPEARQPSSQKERILRTGVVAGALMVVIPFIAAMFSIHEASGVPEGLRGATHIPAMKDKVGWALSSTALMAFLAPAGAVLGVLCGLSLAGGRRPKPEPYPDD
jgi:hypothetical protein